MQPGLQVVEGCGHVGVALLDQHGSQFSKLRLQGGDFTAGQRGGLPLHQCLDISGQLLRFCGQGLRAAAGPLRDSLVRLVDTARDSLQFLVDLLAGRHLDLLQILDTNAVHLLAQGSQVRVVADDHLVGDVGAESLDQHGPAFLPGELLAEKRRRREHPEHFLGGEPTHHGLVLALALGHAVDGVLGGVTVEHAISRPALFRPFFTVDFLQGDGGAVVGGERGLDRVVDCLDCQT